MSANRSSFEGIALPFHQQFHPSYGPNYFGPMPPSWPPVNLLSGLPRMWSSTDPYYRPQYGFGSNNHSADCCLSTQNTEGCRQAEHNHSRCPNCEQLDSSTDDVVINDVTNESATESIDSTLEVMNRKLLEAKLSILDINEKNAIETIDRLERDLKGMAQQIKQQCRRFYNKVHVLSVLMSSATEVYEAMVKTQNLKEWIKSETSAKKSRIMEDINESDGVALIQSKLASDLPVFWQICESLLKSLLVNGMIDEVVKQTEDKSVGKEDKVEDVMENLLKDDPNIGQTETNNSPSEDKEENDNNKNEAVENDTNSDELTSKESIIGKRFGGEQYSVIQLPYIAPSVVVVPQHKGYMDTQQIPNIPKQKIPDMCEPIPELKPTIETNGQTVAPNESKVKVSTQTLKVLDKVNAIYPTKTEEELLEWITASKSILVECGQTKGFSGMKISDVVLFVCEYIKNEDKSAPKHNTHSKQVSGNGKSSLEDCILCRTTIDSKYDMLRLTCKHVFHMNCLDEWAQTNTRCPKCKIPI